MEEKLKEVRKHGSGLGGLRSLDDGAKEGRRVFEVWYEQRRWEPSVPGHSGPGRTDPMAPSQGLGYVWDYLTIEQIDPSIPDSNNISLGLQTSPTLKGRLPHHLCHVGVLWR